MVVVDVPAVPEFTGKAASLPHAADPTNMGKSRTQLKADKVSEGGGTSFIGRSSVWEQGDGWPAPSVRKINVVKIFIRATAPTRKKA